MADLNLTLSNAHTTRKVINYIATYETIQVRKGMATPAGSDSWLDNIGKVNQVTLIATVECEPQLTVRCSRVDIC